MKAKSAFYFLILWQLLSLKRYRRKKGVDVKVIAEIRAFYGIDKQNLGVINNFNYTE
jgi:hypothetical protein